MKVNKMLHSIYTCLPPKIKKLSDYLIGSLPYSLLLGKEYSDTLKMLLSEEHKTRSEHLDYQFRELKRILVYSFENVPYYQKLFNSIGFDPYLMSTFSDIECIPFLTKELIEENFEELISVNLDKNQIGYNSTSGTSGHQLRFAFDKKTYYSREWAYIHYLWRRIGFDPAKSRLAALRNEVLPDGKLIEYDPKGKRWVIDSYHLTPDNMLIILDELKNKRIEYIHTYPSSIYSLAKYILSTDFKYSNYKPKAIIVTSEMLYPGQKEIIEKAFDTIVYTFYGHSERAALASWCECDTRYHIQTEYGYIELIGEDGKPIHESEKIGEIVCTGFNNCAMPLIRYKTADYSSFAKSQECKCGRQYPLLENIEGRWKQSALVGKDGNLITDTAINMHSMIFENVQKFQFVQSKPGVCVLNIVKGDKYNMEDERKIISEVNAKIGDSIDMDVKYVDDIERTSAGKYLYIVRKFKI